MLGYNPVNMSRNDYHSPPQIPSPPPYQPNLSHPPQMSPPPPYQPALSPPPLTKLVQRTTSNPREFFEKLYGPDTSKEIQRKSPSPHQEIIRPYFPTPVPFPHSISPLIPLHYLPSFPLPSHEEGIVNLETIPFPAGFAAFSKYWKYYCFFCISSVV